MKLHLKMLSPFGLGLSVLIQFYILRHVLTSQLYQSGSYPAVTSDHLTQSGITDALMEIYLLCSLNLIVHNAIIPLSPFHWLLHSVTKYVLNNLILMNKEAKLGDLRLLFWICAAHQVNWQVIRCGWDIVCHCAIDQLMAFMPAWRGNPMRELYALLALCVGNPPIRRIPHTKGQWCLMDSLHKGLVIISEFTTKRASNAWWIHCTNSQ